jgi:Domain of unknown function (DUF3859)
MKVKRMSRSRRQQLPVLALGSLALVVALTAAARAQDAHIDRLEVVDAGFYDSAKTTVTGSTPSASTVTGSVQELAELKLLAEPPATSARVGVGFGVRFRSFGERDGERAILRSVWKIPAPGIINPTNGKAYRESVADFPTTIGTNHWRGYGFEQTWEAVPGTWTIEIWQDDRKLLEKSFEIK